MCVRGSFLDGGATHLLPWLLRRWQRRALSICQFLSDGGVWGKLHQRDSASHSHAMRGGAGAIRPLLATHIPISDGCAMAGWLEDGCDDAMRSDAADACHHAALGASAHAAMDGHGQWMRTQAASALRVRPPGASFRVRAGCDMLGGAEGPGLAVASRRTVASRRFYPLQRCSPTAVSLTGWGVFRQLGSTYNSQRCAEMTFVPQCLLFVRAFPIGKDGEGRRSRSLELPRFYSYHGLGECCRRWGGSAEVAARLRFCAGGSWACWRRGDGCQCRVHLGEGGLAVPSRPPAARPSARAA